MPVERLERALAADLETLDREGRRKGAESVVREVVPPAGVRGPRLRLAGHGERLFLRMNSNGYLGLARHPEVIAAGERAAQRFGAGPQAVRFIAGTCEVHVELERRLAAFHGREAGMIFSSAYATVMGVLPSLMTPETVVLSDALNHNCIINAMRLASVSGVRKVVYPHADSAVLERALEEAARDGARRAIVVTDGVFSMRGDLAPLAAIAAAVRRFDPSFAEDALLLVDDSHGVGALGATGRGTEEETGARADLLVGTLGKAIGVNGGYLVGSAVTIAYLREVAPFYVYSNPITPGEAGAAAKALEILEGEEGRERLARLREVTGRFERGLVELGYETIPGPHPVVPLLVRDTARTRALAAHLFARGVLATGLAYPIVPRGEEEIRFQLSADHTDADVSEALDALAGFADR